MRSFDERYFKRDKRKLISEERLTRKYSLKQLLKMQDKFLKCL